MTHFEVRDVLDTFRVIVDTREHSTPKAVERYQSFGVPYEKGTLSYGDYCADAVLPDGRHLVDVSSTITPVCAVERKMSLDELASCFTVGRDRFEREFRRARAANARMILVVENATWEAMYGHRYRSRMNPSAFVASLSAWAIRYDMVPVFCKSGISGRVIREFLYRDLKERLERGEYG